MPKLSFKNLVQDKIVEYWEKELKQGAENNTWKQWSHSDRLDCLNSQSTSKEET